MTVIAKLSSTDSCPRGPRLRLPGGRETAALPPPHTPSVAFGDTFPTSWRRGPATAASAGASHPAATTSLCAAAAYRHCAALCRSPRQGRGRPGLRRAAAGRVERPPARRRGVSRRNQPPPQPHRHAPHAGRRRGRRGRRGKDGRVTVFPRRRPGSPIIWPSSRPSRRAATMTRSIRRRSSLHGRRRREGAPPRVHLPQLRWGRWREAPDGVWPAA